MLRALFISACLATPASAEIATARYSDPTTRYDHGILGDAIEHGTLELGMADGSGRRIVLPETRVFEDTAPRLADVDADGNYEVITVETDLSLGARLAIYDEQGLVAATPFIGRSHRWLAPIATADLDGDGKIEIAYIDRPHLAKLLRIWRFENGALTLVAEKDGLTNHRIGDTTITSGLRHCGQGPELITVDAGWQNVMATQLQGTTINSRAIGPYKGPKSVDNALNCPK